MLNRIPKSKTKISLHEKWKNRKPNLSYLRTWGCLTYARIPNPKRNKLASRAYECVFIGHAFNSIAYGFFDLKDHAIIESNDDEFHKYKFPFKLKNNGGTTSSNVSLVRISEPGEVKEIEPRGNKRGCTTKDFGPDFDAYTIKEDPITLKEALSSLDANLWQEAIEDEMESLESYRTWHLVSRRASRM